MDLLHFPITTWMLFDGGENIMLLIKRTVRCGGEDRLLDFYFEKEYMSESIYLFMDETSVEEEFMSIVERSGPDGPAFWDEESLQIMKDYDGAVRKGNYGIATPKGEFCINALSLECQAVLVIAYAAKHYRDVPVRLNLDFISIDSWIWLSERIDLKILLSRSFITEGIYDDMTDVICCLRRDADIKLEGETFLADTEEGFFRLKQCIDDQLDWCYGLVPEAERKAFSYYEEHEAKNIVLCQPKETLTIDAFPSQTERSKEVRTCLHVSAIKRFVKNRWVRYCFGQRRLSGCSGIWLKPEKNCFLTKKTGS